MLLGTYLNIYQTLFLSLRRLRIVYIIIIENSYFLFKKIKCYYCQCLVQYYYTHKSILFS